MYINLVRAQDLYPHNLFLHSEVIQSHEYNKKDDASIKKVLKYELFDTLFSMIVGWAVSYTHLTTGL